MSVKVGMIRDRDVVRRYLDKEQKGGGLRNQRQREDEKFDQVNQRSC